MATENDHTKILYLKLTHDERDVFVEIIREYAKNIHDLDNYVVLFYQGHDITEQEKRDIEIQLRESVVGVPISEEEFQEQLEHQCTKKKMDNTAKERTIILENYKRQYLQICNEIMNVNPDEEGIYNLEINEHFLDVLNDDCTRVIKKFIKQNPSKKFLQDIYAVDVKMRILLNHYQLGGYKHFFRFIQLLCRNSEVWKSIFTYLINEFKSDKYAFYQRIQEEPKSFESPSIKKRYLEILDFYDKKSWNMNWESITLDLPSDGLLSVEQLSAFLYELEEYLCTKLDGEWGLYQDIILKMVLANTYSYSDTNTYPPIDSYKEDLSVIPLRS